MEAEPASGHFFNGRFFGPALNNNSISGTQLSGSIRTMLAVNKHRRTFRIGCNLQETNSVFIF